MSIAKRILKNSGYLLISRVATKVVSFFILLYIANYLGPANFGKYSFAFAFVYFFSFIPDLGIHQILVREAAKDETIMDKLIGNATIVKSVLSVVAFLLCCLTISVTDYPSSTKNAVFIAAIGLLATSLTGFGIVYEVKLRMDYSLLFNITDRLFLLVSVLYLAWHNPSLNLFIGVTVAAEFINNTLMTISSKHFLTPKFKIDYNLIKKIILEALPIAISSAFVMIYFRIDTVMLSLLTNDTEVGFYSAAYRLTEALTFIPSILMVSTYPIMSKYFNEKNEAFSYIYVKSFKILFASGLMIGTVVTFFSEEIILKIYGSEYYGSIIALQVLIWATSVMFVNYLVTSTYVASGNQNIMAKMSAIAAVLNIGLNLLLIPSYSYTGAGVATFFTELILMVYGVYWINKNIIQIGLFKEIIYPSISICIVSAFLIVSRNYIDVIPLTVVSILIFTGILYITGWVDSDDITLFKKIIPIKK
ncbi:flippase [Methanosarcina sp. MSH10X1]|uniref:flippase n=1 Tax=Methanosarcina sp. MSH10X1 TaxID=2507075 RepID=UPI000FFB458B|nr:flippase [Methanosarcina sp. MSH10X1]RXA20929.1 flippase [Methanosarcina sp. MSH10X1]